MRFLKTSVLGYQIDRGEKRVSLSGRLVQTLSLTPVPWRSTAETGGCSTTSFPHPTHHVSQKWHFLFLANRSYVVRREERREFSLLASSPGLLRHIHYLNQSQTLKNRTTRSLRFYDLNKWWILHRCVGFKTYCALQNLGCTMTS